jgi:purine-binding chemotaxis protein CheW
MENPLHMSTLHQYCTFYANGLFFGVEVLRVQEVIRSLEMTPVPLASATVRGLINLRGQIVTAIDLRRRLELPADAADAEPMNVILRSEDGALSLLVDEIGDVLEVDSATHETPPETLRGPARELVSNVCKLKDRLLLVLDVDKLISLPLAHAHA